MGLVRAGQRPVGRDDLRAVGMLPHLGKVSGVLAEKMDELDLIEVMDEERRRLGGKMRVWWIDRLATEIV